MLLLLLWLLIRMLLWLLLLLLLLLLLVVSVGGRYRRAAGVYEKAVNKLQSASRRGAIGVFDGLVMELLVKAAECHEKEGYFANSMDAYRKVN